jgi:uncharacterized protein
MTKFLNIFKKKKEELLFQNYQDLLDLIKQDFKIDFYGDHGIEHWQRVYLNTQLLSKYYGVQSKVFELFSILHDSKRENEYRDINHGKRASEFVKVLIEKKMIILNDVDQQRLIYACKNHTKSDKKDKLYKDLIIQICFDSDRMDIGRVGIIPNEKYLSTDYAKELIQN